MRELDCCLAGALLRGYVVHHVLKIACREGFKGPGLSGRARWPGAQHPGHARRRADGKECGASGQACQGFRRPPAQPACRPRVGVCATQGYVLLPVQLAIPLPQPLQHSEGDGLGGHACREWGEGQQARGGSTRQAGCCLRRQALSCETPGPSCPRLLPALPASMLTNATRVSGSAASATMKVRANRRMWMPPAIWPGLA